MIELQSIVKLTDRMIRTANKGYCAMRRSTRGVDWATRRGTVIGFSRNRVEAVVMWDGTRRPQYWPVRALETAPTEC